MASSITTIKTPSIPLSQLKSILNTIPGQYEIAENAYEGADVFGWGGDEIVRCLKKLKLIHFHKTVKHWDSNRDRLYKDVMVDYYHARNIYRGVDIYTHFFLDKPYEILQIQSFKKLL